MPTHLSRCTLLLALACGDKDAADTAAGADGASDGADGASDGADGASDGADGGSDGAFHAEGTYDGEAFTVTCFFDGTDPDWTGDLQCQDGIQFFAWCRPDPDEPVPGGLDVFQVWFNLAGDLATTGTHDGVGTGALSVGDGMAAPLTTTSENIVSAEIVVDSVVQWTQASGTFSAEWSDAGDPWAGDHTATLTGSFDLACP